MPTRIVISFQGPEEWEDNREKVDAILEKDTGTSEYPATKSLPPFIVGPEVSDSALEELKALDGVIVRTPDDD
ncbi:hypothetical protein Dda_1524 [Drechslerella dactyloides]|uniref:Uncharacterized protein n=1 Tax=Drechslerella dactyloides TaxID=74499 RepID=A0AAD6J6A7_DREDA|nr:hypothetical protein Dda_1524 [Drechslerella dactyloides]